MLRKFPSINHADIHAYSYDSDCWSANSQIETSFRQYQTYGDGICQHSSDWPVTREYLTDYLLSLASAMLADNELTEHLYYTLMRSPRKEDIDFAASVIYRPLENGYEKKRRYFSLSEKKISTNPAKEHDKRYQEITSKHTGQPDAIYSILIPEYASGLMMLQHATAIYDWSMNQQSPHYMELPARFLSWTKDSQAARDMRDAYELVKAVCTARQSRQQAEETLARYLQRAERAKMLAAVPASTAASSDDQTVTES